MKSVSHAVIESAIRSTGSRVTAARVRVLGLLQAAHGPLSHREIEGLLSQDASPCVDRVTLYRILDWLVASGLAHRAADARGVFCFSLALPDRAHQQHLHFRCTTCGGVFCLDAPLPTPPDLPPGFRLSSAEFDIHGECPACARTHQTAPT